MKKRYISKKFIPKELAARSADEVAIVVKINEDNILIGTYGSESKGYQPVYSVEWYDTRIDETVTTKTFYGGQPPYEAEANYDHYGSKPSEKAVKEWIEETYQNVFDHPYIDEAIEGFHLVIPVAFLKNEDDIYEHSEIMVEPFALNKDEFEVYELEEMLPICKLLLESTEDMVSVSNVQYNKNGIPYFTYEMETTSTSQYLVTTNKYFGVFAVFETDNSFQTVDFYCSTKKFSSIRKAEEKFVKWSELCYVSNN